MASHGELARFRSGCRCRRCKDAINAYKREWRARGGDAVDRDRANARALKMEYAGVCEKCGCPTTGSRGPGKAPTCCVECFRDEVRLTPEERRERNRLRQKRIYAEHPEYRQAQRARYINQPLERRNAWEAVRRARERGDLVKPDSCEACGSDKWLHAHHEDYGKPLAVEWLCALCHKRRHAVSSAA